MRALRLLSVLLVVVFAGCSATPAGGAALQVQVVLAAGTTSRCVKVSVDDGASRRESAAIAVEGRSLLRVAVYQDDLAQPVLLEALGFADDACTVPTTPPERSESAEGRFVSPPATVTLTLRPQAATDAGTPDAGEDAGLPSDAGSDDAGVADAGTEDAGVNDAGVNDAGVNDAGLPDAAVDLDLDGYSPPADCDDSNGAINPDAGERCTGGVDDDCDGQVDCADSQCLNQACGVNGTCLAGTCQAPTETGLCADGLDNDQDSLVDCADPDCPAGVACSDSNGCTRSDVCGGDAGCVSGSDLTCTMPPGQCFDAMGACLPDAGTCSYAVRTGSCDDGLGCTGSDTCLADGGCTGAPRLCDAPPGACFGAVGSCLEPTGACTYPPLPTGTCSDGQNCTVNDTCDGDGGCVGTPVTCTAPSQCLTATGTCDADGGCLFAPLTGQACDAGTGAGSCSDAGACVLPPAIFPYVPSNFTEGQLPASGGAMTFDCGTTTLDTRAADGGIAWTNACGAIASAAFSVITVGGQEAVLLYAESLSVPSGNTLRAVGARPLIVAVRTTASVAGTINVGSASGVGAGANLDCGAAQGGNGGAANSRGGGGGGGAFGQNGAAGAVGDDSAPAGTAGTVTGTAALVPLRGGCRGGDGGRTSGSDGPGGSGGGALQLSVGGALTIAATGRIAAPGAGGARGIETGSGAGIGGGGGGSGGGLLLEAATVSLVSGGAVTANGGGGGEGGGITTNGVAGAAGSTTATTRAAGGNGGGCGGDGGGGGAQAGNPVAGAGEDCTNNGGSGGGGGGGAGRVRFNASTSCSLLGTVSPAASGNGTMGCPAP